MPERKKAGLVPRKNGLDTAKYGGYNNKTAAYFSLVKVKNDIVFIPVDLIDSDKFLNDEKKSKEVALTALYQLTEDEESELTVTVPEDISGILKTFDLRFDDNDISLSEKLLEYMISSNEFKDKNLFIIINLRASLKTRFE